MEKLERTIADAMTSAEKLKFNLDQFDMNQFEAFAKSPKFAEENIANWELYKVLNDKKLLDKTIFYGADGQLTRPPKLP